MVGLMEPPPRGLMPYPSLLYPEPLSLCMDLTEAEDIKKRWQEYTEELYKKDPHDPDNHDGVITHLEPDILECEVKWVLGGICTKLVEVMGFQLSYFKS